MPQPPKAPGVHALILEADRSLKVTVGKLWER
jgi:hypothetical protein